MYAGTIKNTVALRISSPIIEIDIMNIDSDVIITAVVLLQNLFFIICIGRDFVFETTSANKTLNDQIIEWRVPIMANNPTIKIKVEINLYCQKAIPKTVANASLRPLEKYDNGIENKIPAANKI